MAHVEERKGHKARFRVIEDDGRCLSGWQETVYDALRKSARLREKENKDAS
jgi:hypothetical protein